MPLILHLCQRPKIDKPFEQLSYVVSGFSRTMTVRLKADTTYAHEMRLHRCRRRNGTQKPISPPQPIKNSLTGCRSRTCARK